MFNADREVDKFVSRADIFSRLGVPDVKGYVEGTKKETDLEENTNARKDYVRW